MHKLSIAPALVAVLLLAGCAPTASSAPSPTPTVETSVNEQACDDFSVATHRFAELVVVAFTDAGLTDAEDAELKAMGGTFESAAGQAALLADAASRASTTIGGIPNEVTVSFITDYSRWEDAPPTGGLPGGVYTPGVQENAAGGWVRGGTPGQDSVLSWLMPDELIIPASHTGSLTDAMRFVSGLMPNDTEHFAAGGRVGGGGIENGGGIAPTIIINLYGSQATPQAVASAVSRVLTPPG